MPQTEEHLAICRFLGITRGLAVLSKADLVSADRLEEVCNEVRRYLATTFLGDAPLLPVSAFTGEGIAALRSELAELAARTPVRNAAALPRLPLDRAFVVKGFGTVVTGTLQSGTLTRGQILSLEPGAIPVKIRGVQMHGRSEEQAVAGSRVALNLSGVDVAEVHRGLTLVPPSSITAVEVIDAEITLLPEAAELRHRARVRFHCFTSEAMATVSLYDYQPVQPGDTRMVRLKLAMPVVLLPGDRFVLRRPSPAQTLGGGRVVDAHPLPRLRKKSVPAWLSSIQDAPAEQQLLLRTARRGTAGSTVAQLGQETGWTSVAIGRLTSTLISHGKLAALPGGLLLTREAFSSGMESVFSQVKAPVRRSELRSRTGLAAAVFDAALARLAGEEKLRVGGTGPGQEELVSLFAACATVPDADRKHMALIASMYESAGLNAPLFSDVLRKLGGSESEARRLMTQLLRSKTLVKLGTEDLYMHRGALEELEAKVRALRGQRLDVGGFKQLTGLSRKYAIPLLEYLDRAHVTRKQGDTRLVL
jgi:selenocysteine-specific elongation factor